MAAARTVAAAAMVNLANMEVSPLGCGGRRDAVRRWEEASPRRFPADCANRDVGFVGCAVTGQTSRETHETLPGRRVTSRKPGKV
jgi:hypothetical protein